jgi:hypothetical protein
VQPYLRTELEEASVRDILDRILDGCIAFDPAARFVLTMTDFKTGSARVVVSPERRRLPFIIPSRSSGG